MPGKGPRLPEFYQLFEHAHDGIIILSADERRVLDANPKAADLMGRTRDELVDRRLAEFVSQDLDDLTAFTKLVHNHGVGWTDELSWPGKAGRPSPVEISASGFEGPAGRFILLVLHSPGEVRARERHAAATRARRQADSFRRQLDRFQQEVLNTTAHEFRTPLTPITIQLAIIERNLAQFLSTDDRASLDVIRRNAVKIERSIENIVKAAGRRPDSQPRTDDG